MKIRSEYNMKLRKHVKCDDSGNCEIVAISTGGSRTFKELRHKRLLGIATVLVTLVVSITGVVYWALHTENNAVSNMRTIYIETAMSTMNHQWLATSFISSEIINKVTQNNYNQYLDNMVETSDITYIPDSTFKELSSLLSSLSVSNNTSIELDAKLNFENNFPYIDINTMPNDVDYNSIQLADAVSKGIKTIYGDSVWAVDTVNNLAIIAVKGNRFNGKLAIINDSSKVYLQHTTSKSRGQTVTEMCNNNDCVLGINGSGFVDYNGRGNGSKALGLLKSNNVIYNEAVNDGYCQVGGFDTYDNFRVGTSVDLNTIRDAVQFYPVIVLNGEKHAVGTYGLGLQPRSVVGQTDDKRTLLLVIDGRQVGYSLGATVGDCSDIMIKYGAYNALNLDGGSSSSMTYNGKMITKTSSPAKNGRYIPSCWVVKRS